MKRPIQFRVIGRLNPASRSAEIGIVSIDRRTGLVIVRRTRTGGTWVTSLAAIAEHIVSGQATAIGRRA